MNWHGVTWQNAVVLAIFVVMCGFIAYAGDLLGRRMGKHRLSLFGLRPRHTAIVTTIITGMLIAAFTMGTMAVVSQRVRLLFLHGMEIVAERKQLQHNLDKTRKSYEIASTELTHQRSAAQSARADAALANRERAALEAEIRIISMNLTRLRASLRDNRLALAASQSHLAVAKGDLTKARKEVATRRKTISDQTRQIAELQTQKRKLTEDIGYALKRWPIYVALRQGNIVFHSGDEISRSIIPCAERKSEIKRDLSALLSEADKRARKEGARAGDNGRAIQILPVKVVGTYQGTGRFLEEDATLDAIADNISNGSGSVVLRIISVGNSVEGEQALVNFVPNYNRLVYRAGEEVSSIVVDGRQSRGTIFGELVQFFKDEVRAAAIRKGVIPTSDDEGQQSVGQITGDQLFELVDTIKASGRPVKLRAVCATDIWSGKSLVLNLVVSGG